MDFLLKSGKLVDDRLISQMVFSWFIEKKDHDSTIILDGYPRTLVQAQVFDEMIQEQEVPIEIRVVRFRISDQVVISRICGRLICQDKECQQVYSTLSGSSQAPQLLTVCDVCKGPLGKRTDDTESSVKERLKIYFQHEKGMLDFYKQKGYSIEEFSAEQQAPEVFEQFKKLIGTPRE
jgi:adenylate kinase